MFAKFSFAFYGFLTVLIVNVSQILTGIYFIFLENVLDQTQKAFSTKFGRQWKSRKVGSNKVGKILAHFFQISCSNFRLKLCQNLELHK